MRIAFKLCFALILASCVVLDAVACSCAVPIDMERELGLHKPFAIFQAKAVQVSDTKSFVPSKDNPQLGTERIDEHVTWQIQKTWVGPYAGGTSVQTDTNVACCICGLSVKQGDVYVIHLHAPAPVGLSACSYSKPLSEAAADIPILDRLYPSNGS